MGVRVDIRISDWTRLGSAVRDARKARGFSQHELANRAGVSRSWLARLETGHRGAELEPLFRLLNALELSLTLRDPIRRSDEADPGQAATTAATDAVREGNAPLAPGLSVVAKHQAAAAGRRRAWRAASAPTDNDDPDDGSSSELRGGTEGRGHDG